MVIAVSGPCMTGKSTIINLLADRLPPDTVYVDDIFKVVWEELKGNSFSYFSEVIKDRDFTILYISKLVKYYKDLIKELPEDKLVVMENCYIDYLIYAQLNVWYHYPLGNYLEGVINDLLNTQCTFSRVYVATPDDLNYPMTKSTILDCKTIKAYFKRSRPLENKFYDIYRNLNNCRSLPSSVIESEDFILTDLRSLGII